MLTASQPANAEQYQQIDDEDFDLENIYNNILQHPQQLYYVLCTDPRATIKKLQRVNHLVEAAGGLVQNQKGEYLFIYRNGKWDLPKGKIEKKEKTKVAAVREIEEECGIKVKLGQKICKTYHTYIWKGKFTLKKTHWFAMDYKGNQKLVPQLEEGITDVRWFKTKYINDILGNTFPSIIDVLEKSDLITKREELLSE